MRINIKNWQNVMVKNIFCFLFMFLCSCGAWAGPCDEYKHDVKINLERAKSDFNIVPSDRDLWPVGGFIKVVPFYQLKPEIGYMFNGKYYCVFLNSVDATVGFRDFEIVIDKKYKSGSCEYDAVLGHEKHHMADAIHALDLVFDDVAAGLQNAANEIEPIYVENTDDVPYKFEEIQNKLIQNKKLKSLVDKFKEQTTRDAEHLDGTPDEHLEKCHQEKMDAAWEKYYKNKK